jgi:exoribonuclease R
MWEIAEKLKKKRKHKVNLDFDEANKKTKDDSKINYEDRASILTEEFMIAANIEIAQYLIKNKIL